MLSDYFTVGIKGLNPTAQGKFFRMRNAKHAFSFIECNILMRVGQKGRQIFRAVKLESVYNSFIIDLIHSNSINYRGGGNQLCLLNFHRI